MSSLVVKVNRPSSSLKKMKMKQKRAEYSGYVILVLTVILFTIPLYCTVTNSFKFTDDIIRNPFALPMNFTFGNFQDIFANPNVPLFEMYKNTFTITVLSLTMIVLTAPLAGYYIARNNTKRSNFVLIFFMAGMMVPPQLTFVPIVKMFISLHLMGKLISLVLFYMSGSTVAILMYSKFIKTIPYSLEESAIIDGASRFRVFWQVVFPLLKPCTATVITFNGLSIWNDFMTPLILLRGKLTITMGIHTAIGPYSANWGLVFAFAIISALPILILYIWLQKWFISGLTAGAVKS